jgi:hypothetical protein
MKTAKSIIELATEIQRQSESKKDFIVPTQVAQVEINGNQQISFNGNVYDLTDHALAQIADRIKIPKRYVDYLRAEFPSLLEHNINDLFVKFPEQRMIRTLDGQARAFLSDRYRPLDNMELADAIFPALKAADAEIVSCDITTKKLYVKAILPHISALIPGGSHFGDDNLNPGVTISNSEIGCGGLTVLPALHDPKCTNICNFVFAKYSKYHLGGKGSADDQYNVFTNETKQLADATVFAQMTDVVKASMGGEVFQKIVDHVKTARGQKIEATQVTKVIEVVAEKHGFNEDEKGSVLAHLIERGDLSQWGLSSAITRASADIESYDRASELEGVGGQVIELPANQWRAIAQVA